MTKKQKEPKVIWTNFETVGEVIKTEGTKLVVSIAVSGGVKYLHIHEWYMRKRDQVWKPGMKGITCPIHIPLNGEISKTGNELMLLLAGAIAKAESLEMDVPDNYVYAKTKEDK